MGEFRYLLPDELPFDVPAEVSQAILLFIDACERRLPDFDLYVYELEARLRGVREDEEAALRRHYLYCQPFDFGEFVDEDQWI